MADIIEITRAEYTTLKAAQQDLADILAAEDYDRRAMAGEEEALPSVFIDGMLKGESLLKLWREHRGLTQTTLAEKSGVNRVLIAQIETGVKTGSVASLKKLAQSLDIILDDLV